MEQIQKATLVLKGLDAISANQNTRMTWNNINLPLLLGDMYQRFDNFNLKLDNIACDDDRLYDAGTNTYQHTAGADNSDRIVTLNLSGLNFLNSTYDTGSNTNSSSTIIGTYCFYETFSRDYHSSITTFTKGGDSSNITIEYKTVLDDVKPQTISSYPKMTFLFSIYGIPGIEKK